MDRYVARQVDICLYSNVYMYVCIYANVYMYVCIYLHINIIGNTIIVTLFVVIHTHTSIDTS